MKEEIKALLKDELKAVSKSKKSILVGTAMVALDVILVATSLISFYSLIFILPLIFILRKQIQEYRVNQMMLILTRYIIDDEYSQTFNIKEEEDGRI
jgi:hypothetical protein